VDVFPSGLFQSLFSWMTLIGCAMLAVASAAIGVSILVFLDDAHRRDASDLGRERPCTVSILVFLDDAHRREGPYRRAQLRVMFQSLFSWMTLIGGALVSFGGRRSEVSILVFLDDAHRLETCSRLGRRENGFQSLFSWMTLIGV